MTITIRVEDMAQPWELPRNPTFEPRHPDWPNAIQLKTPGMHLDRGAVLEIEAPVRLDSTDDNP